MTPSSDQLQALLDLAEALHRAVIPYALIGAIAIGIHSDLPRATNDVDIAVATSVARSVVVGALTAQFELTGEFSHSLNFRHASGEPVQASFDEPFDEMIDRAEKVTFAGSALKVVTRADLIATKERAANDPARRRSKALRDLADIGLLKGDVPDEDEGW